MDNHQKWTLSSLESAKNSDSEHSFFYRLKLTAINLIARFFGDKATLKLVIILVAILAIGGFIFYSKFINKPTQIAQQPSPTPDTSSPIPNFTPNDTPIDSTTNKALGVSTSVKATATPQPSPSTTPTPTPSATPSPTPTDTPSTNPSPSQSPVASTSASLSL